MQRISNQQKSLWPEEIFEDSEEKHFVSVSDESILQEEGRNSMRDEFAQLISDAKAQLEAGAFSLLPQTFSRLCILQKPIAETPSRWEEEVLLLAQFAKEALLLAYRSSFQREVFEQVASFFSSNIPLPVFEAAGEVLREIYAETRGEESDELRSFRKQFLVFEREAYQCGLDRINPKPSNFSLLFERYCTDLELSQQVLRDPYILAHHYTLPDQDPTEQQWESLSGHLLDLVSNPEKVNLEHVLSQIGERRSVCPEEILVAQRKKAFSIYNSLQTEEMIKSFALRLSDGEGRCADGIHLLLEELAARYLCRASSSLGGKVSRVLQKIKEEFIAKHGDPRVLLQNVGAIRPQIRYSESNTYLPLYVQEQLRSYFSLRGEPLSFQYSDCNPQKFENQRLGVESAQYRYTSLFQRFFSGGRLELSDNYCAVSVDFSPFSREDLVRAVYDNLLFPSGHPDKVIFRQDITDFMSTYYDEELHFEYKALLREEAVENKYFTETFDPTQEGIARILTLLGYIQER
jgi:hypothetical protein